MAFMCNTSKIKSMKLENPKTVMFKGDVKPNGTIVTLKATHGERLKDVNMTMFMQLNS